CGVETTRPRGHTSLGGAADAQHAVKRIGKTSTLTVEFMKDGEEGAVLSSQLEIIDLYLAPDLDPITSCVLVPADNEAVAKAAKQPKMTPNQKTMFSLLHAAGRLKVDDWNEQARAAGIGVKRRADLIDIRIALKDKGLIKLVGNEEWGVDHEH